MTRRTTLYIVSMAAAAAAVLAACAGGPMGSQNKTSFFMTSTNPGKGADFGGLAGADRYCQSLAASAGASSRTWRAYLSDSAMAGSPAVHARDRIGSGPWYNVKGELIASNVDELHGTNKISKQTALTEKGGTVSGSGDPVNLHDVLTGSSPDGRAVSDGKDNSCGNWTKGGEGSAIVGHFDRMGLRDDAPSKSWNSSHATQGCSLDALQKTGGGGLMYCFAEK
jgi:hypothetical protein